MLKPLTTNDLHVMPVQETDTYLMLCIKNVDLLKSKMVQASRWPGHKRIVKLYLNKVIPSSAWPMIYFICG